MKLKKSHLEALDFWRLYDLVKLVVSNDGKGGELLSIPEENMDGAARREEMISFLLRSGNKVSALNAYLSRIGEIE